MTPRRSSRVIAAAAVVLAAMALSACSSFPDISNPFEAKAKPSRASPGERISLLELNDQLKVSDTLKGQDFFLPPPAPIADWPVAGGTPEQSVEHVAAAPDFEIAWRKSFGDPSSHHIHVMAPPIMADGKLFVMDAMADVSAHDASNGNQIWRTNLMPKSKRDREAFGGGLAYSGGKIYATSGFRIVAQIDAASGHLDWTTHTDAPLHSAPAVAGGLVYVVDVDDQLLTFDTADGKPSWTYQGLTEPARMLVASSPAVSGDTLVASFASGELVALRASNGTELWTNSLSRTSRSSALSEIRDIAGRPVIYKGDVFAVSHADMMTATDLRTGSVRWDLPVAAITSPWAAGDVVYVVDQTGQVICISRNSGQLYWLTDLNAPVLKGKAKHQKLTKRGRDVWSSPILASNRLITVSDKGEAVALDPKTGAIERRLKIGDDALLGPIAAGNYVYLATQKADLIAIR